jgi:hypothetical protein
MLKPSARRLTFLLALAATAFAGAGTADATWTAPTNVSPLGPTAYSPEARVDSAGNAMLGWVSAPSGGGDNAVLARIRSAGGTLGPLRTIAPSTQTLVQSGFDTDASGTGYFAWIQSDGINNRVEFRTLSSSSVLAPVEDISRSGRDAEWPAIGVNGTGESVIAWADASNRIYARLRKPNGKLGPYLRRTSPGSVGREPAALPRYGGARSSPTAASARSSRSRSVAPRATRP